MPDDISISEGSGRTVAADEVDGKLHQRVKISVGADGAATDAVGGAGTTTAAVLRTTLATDHNLSRAVEGDYERVTASQTAQVLGSTGAAGDYISHITVTPEDSAPGNIALLDGDTSMTIFVGGSGSVSNRVPFTIPLGMVSVNGAWKITTGSGISCIAVGSFT